jgi:ribonucleoside-diphosphate reductase alpha chain
MNIEQWLGKENQLGIDIWKKKYQHNNETFDEWLDRVSAGNEEIRQLIVEKKFLFGGRILSNRGLAGDGRKLTYSNCYVIVPPEDNIESIFECAGKLARTFSYGGGCGVDISKLSPRGAKIRNSAKATTGAVSFMDLYDLVTSLIGQNGRRAALMLSIDCNHPDLQEFISVKNDLNKVTKANISVKVTNEFMEAVLGNQFYRTTFVREETGEEIAKVVYAPDIFRQLCENNWNFGEPGILFWDKIRHFNMLSNNHDFEFAGVNPCAEQPLPAGGSCLLGSINLSEFVTDDKQFDSYAFEKAVIAGVKALNEVLDEGLILHPLEEQQNSVRDWRQIGLGVFGIADMLIKMELRYDDDKAIELCNMIAEDMMNTALYASACLAKEFGPYPKYDKELLMNNPFFMYCTDPETEYFVGAHGLRNSQLLTIAPTGSISTMLGVSGGIEPIFDTHYMRKTESLHGHDEYYTVYTPIVKKYMEENDISKIEDLPDFFVTAKTINPMKRVEMQAAWQEFIDASISSTINLPESATVEDVERLYIYAWQHNLKGLTIFRENCARTGILTTEKKEESVEIHEDDIIAKPEATQLDTIVPITREELGCRLSGSTYVKEVACGHLYITINRDENDNLVEVFIDPGKSGGCVANAECLGRYASACMRSGISIDSIVDITKGVKCSACSQMKGSKIKHIDGLSCGDVVAKTIQEEYNRYKHEHKKNITQPKKTETKDETKENVCPECGVELAAEGGCVICKNCGFSKCD